MALAITANSCVDLLFGATNQPICQRFLKGWISCWLLGPGYYSCLPRQKKVFQFNSISQIRLRTVMWKFPNMWKPQKTIQHFTILALKPMVCWGSPIFKEEHMSYLKNYVYIYIYTSWFIHLFIYLFIYLFMYLSLFIPSQYISFT